MTAFSARATDDTPALVALLERQRSLYADLRELSRQQAPLIDGGHAEPLLRVLAQRQRLIDELSQVNGQLDPFRQRWDALWARLAGAERSRVGVLVREVQALLADILQQDERDRAALAATRERIGGEIQRMSRAGAAINAYRTGPAHAAPASAGNNRFTNQRG